MLLGPQGLCALLQGLEVFKEEHGRYPDLVVLHSNYWDVAQIVLFREDDGREHAYGPLMKASLANAEQVAKFLQVPPRPLCEDQLGLPSFPELS